ncbi:hypothetical protein PS918_04500 [Pseudomonas fluorescens]|uniref:Dermonecrotic toxin N-terminal domain-containing protein n=1 Tax=Pseudomonas fluorescens TaxID=294 RepID=A0A5E7U2Q6_PSEFL|nr:DUF6543 domain-containing protein [Pseudomonas fluorescens]VVQ04386.1 hypothetical protein PS918_04500 [Pseudomonas fluorescens]
MQLPNRPQSATTTDTQYPEHPDSHYQHLKNSVPTWLGQASSAKRQALKNTQPKLLDRLQAAPAAQHQALKTLNAAHWTAQNEVDRRLARLQDASAFAEPLLKAALKSRFGLDLDVKATFLRLYVPATIPWFPIKTGARAWTVSLVEAALHNFEATETGDAAYEAHSTFITQPSDTGQFETLPAIKQNLSIPAFIRLCRELDIGAQYKSHLEENLGITSPVAASVLRLKVNESQKAAMKAALQMARMTGDVSEQYVRLIEGLLDGLQGMRVNGQALLCQDLTMMSATLTGPLVFAPDLESSETVAKVVTYVPDDPEHPFKEYASTAGMATELIRQLRSKDYQRFFSRFVDHEKRGVFFASLNQRLTKITWHEPVQGSSLPSWRETPIDRPNLQFAITPINANLWQHLYQGKLNKILNDARVIAVSTATADQKARWALWDSFVNIASTILQVAAFIVAPFVPVLGELMMAYMAYQLLDEAFEGIIEWAEGQNTEALEHLLGVVESLIQLGAFAAGGAIGVGEFRKALPKEIVAFIDRFKPVERPDGQTRYWKPELMAYQHESIPGPNSRPDKLGLHPHEGKQLLPLDQAHFAVSEGPVAGQYRIDHPTRPDAYKPALRHNGEGAWHTELEQPLEWDAPTALRRIGPSVDAFTPARREQILKVSGYTEDALRKMHVDQEPVPPLLADSIKRFKIDQDLQQFIEQLDSELPAQYLAADPLTQLQLLARHERWPTGKGLSWVDEQGDIAWTSSTDETLPLTVVRQDNLLQGDLLKTLLQSLNESDIKTLLGEEFSGPTLSLDARARTLRKQLVQLARKQRTAMFESRYTTLENTPDPLARQIAQHHPQLPASVTRELLHTATGAELQQISQGRLPERQQALVALANQEVRVTRAFEGLELDSVSNPDTETLALHSLHQLPGWTGDVRIEVRDRSYTGQRLDSIGRADAPAQKVLVRYADGTWQPYDESGQALHSATDYYSGILYALPDAERQALDIHIEQGQKLKEAIRARPLERNELRVTISPQPIQEAAVDTLRLLGSDGYGRILRTVRTTQEPPTLTLEQRVREVYPGLSPQEVQALLATLRNHAMGPRAELSRLHSAYERLCTDLHRWANEVPNNDPVSGVALTTLERQAAVQNRALLKQAIQRCWRRETRGPAGYMLHIPGPILGDLPALNADFSHVVVLSINGSPGTGALEPFLQNFPGLMHLDISNLGLQTLPQAITSMPMLRHLIVRNSGIAFSPADQQALSSLRGLALLDLQDNPLTLTPDLQAMPALRHVNLANTGISTVPPGLLNHPQLLTGRFDGNRISVLPDGLFTLAGDLGAGFVFENNPLTPAMHERIKIYYTRTGKHFGVLPDQTDLHRTMALFPERDVHQATDLLYRLPGTLVEGRTRLTEWETEIARLTSDLAQWSANVPARHPATDQPLTVREMFSEQVAREAFGQELESVWRNRLGSASRGLESELKFIGDLPVLTADFSHVSRLTLTGNKAVTATTPFLQRFTGLRSLTLNNFALHQVPRAITHLPELEALVLIKCDVVLTPDSQAALVSRAKLVTLELSHNPLGTAPDLTTLPGLTYIDLSNTGLTTVPAELAEHANLNIVILSDNQITELPDTLFALPTDRIDGFDFEGNPFSAATRERIKTCFRATGQDFGVLADQADIDLAKELFPALDAQDASDMIYDLPGTLEEGRVQLRHWRAELRQLTEDLSQWARNVATHHPLSGKPLDASQVQAEQVSRAEFQQKLEQFWRLRRESSNMRAEHFEANLAFFGDMPLLTTDFSHVQSLTLNGNSTIGGTGPFLELFPDLHTLQMRQFALDQIPQALPRMTRLKELELTHCRVTLTPAGQTTLSSLVILESLDLSGNPLVLTPDLTAMSQLSDIRLSDTAITSLPNGLTTLPHMSNAFLDGNQITELPDALFSPDLDLVEKINLANNPLSPTSRNKIKTRYAATKDDFAVLAEQADIERTQTLFPQLDTDDANHVIYTLSGTLEDGRAQLTLWETEIAGLRRELSDWVDDVPAQNPSTDQSLSAEEINDEVITRNAFAQSLEQFWRQRETEKPEVRADTFAADLGFIGDMPVLTADFSHVTELSLIGNKALGVPARFLEPFTGLQHLELRDFTLGRLPQAITHMPSLNILAVINCGVVLDAEGLVALASRTRLEMIDLANNPLARVPDVSTLQALTYIDLSNTGIDRVPVGLPGHARIETAILSDNRITELPDEIFNLPADTGSGLDFGNNPYSTTTRERIKAYHRKTGNDLGVAAPQADIDQAIELYPGLNPEQASDYIYHLPGTLADGRLELARKKSELASLISELTVWMTDIPNDPVTGEPLDAEALLQEQFKRMTFKTGLEQCWRQLPTENAFTNELSFVSSLSIMGDLPVLSADFGHVLELYLTSTGSIVPRASRFLDYFPNLHSLAVRGYQLDNIPEAIFKMNSLTALSLPECRITLTRRTVDALADMENLDSLNLRNNPLGLTPDLRNLRHLSSLDLSNSGLREMPRGVLDSTSLTHADLSNNAITDMPIELLDANPDHTANYDLSGNPFSPRSLERIAAHYHETGNTLGINAVRGMPRPGNQPPDEEMES